MPSQRLRLLYLLYLRRQLYQKTLPEGVGCLIGQLKPCDNYWAARRRVQTLYTLILRRREQRRSARAARRWWVRPIFQNREFEGEWHTLVPTMRESDPQRFFNYFRMDPDRFDDILELVSPYLQKHSWRENISPGERLGLTLRYLASGQMMVDISYAWRISQSTVSGIIYETCRALWLAMKDKVFEPITEELWENVANDFELLWNFPNCCGAIDGKHCVVQAFANSGSEYYNYKGTNSIVLLGVCDARYKFIVVDIGGRGRRSDGGILKQSVFGKLLESNGLGLPPPRSPARSNRKLPFVFVGDAAFPLRANLMKPYPGEFLPVGKTIFNYRLSRARRVVENAFGILCARWRILLKTITASEATVKAVVRASVCLHNYMMSSEEVLRPQDRLYNPVRFGDVIAADGRCIRGQWRQEVPATGGLRPFPASANLGSHNYTAAAATAREEFHDYFIDEGQVFWQWTKVPHQVDHEEENSSGMDDLDDPDVVDD